MADFQVTGNIRIPNAGAFLARDANDSIDLNVFSFDASNNMAFGSTSMIAINVAVQNTFRVAGEIQVVKDSIHALRILNAAATVSTLIVDTNNNEVEINSDAPLQWSNDLKLFRDGPWELALRDGLNDNFFYVYGTFTDANNYERLALYAGGSGNHFLEPQSAGTGNININLTVRAGGNAELKLGNAANPRTVNLDASQVRARLGSNGAAMSTSQTRQVSGVLSSGSSFTFTNVIPGGSQIIAVMTKVTAVITGATGYDVGDGVDVDRWAANVLAANGSDSDLREYTDPGLEPHYSTVPEDVVITAVGGDFTAGEVTCIVIFHSVTANAIS